MELKLNTGSRKIIVEVICLLYILLFVYAAVSKLLDFENFQVQLGQSPLLSAFASWVSWLIPMAEFVIVLLLLIPKFKTVGLYAAFSLMIMFSAYIFIVLNYSSFVPCSCGGILEKMSWKVHLIFNLVLVILAALAVLFVDDFSGKSNTKEKYRPITRMVLLAFVSIVTMSVLFVSSEEVIHHKNPFIRRYPKKAVVLNKTIDLKFNSYYFAGYRNNNIYLANYTDPLHLLAIDTLGNQKRIKLYFAYRTLPFKAIKIIVRGNYVYLTDGTLPCIYRGSVKDWRIVTKFNDVPKFTLVQPIDSLTMAIRNNTGKDKANVLGIYDAKNRIVRYTPDLLTRQLDGIFDTDGMLLYDERENLILYSYFYRNQFVIADRNGDLMSKGNTIDTNTRAKIKVAYLKNDTERQMAAPPLKVNSLSAVHRNLLFINSKVPGRFEDEKLWKKSSVIDVYNLGNNSYVLSFYIQEIPDQKIQSFYVTDKHLYVTAGTNMMIFNLGHLIENEMNSGSYVKYNH